MKLESQLQVYTLAGVAPFTVNQATLVTNLNAQYLEGQIGSYYRNAGNLNAGTLLAARLPAFTGDVTSTVGTVGLALAASGATAGTYNNVTVNAKGLVTGGSNASYLTSNQSISITGDATGSGSTGIVLTLANVLATPGTYTKVTSNAKGLITAGTSLTSADLPTYTGTITSGQVTTGLGFTPYNASNPSNYITSSGSITGNAATATNGFTFKPGWAGNQNLIAATGNLNSSVPSGFYEAFQATNSPTPTTWCNLINVRHSNTGNDHGFQLAMGYYDETLWSRTYQGGTGANNGNFTTWRAHLHSGNYSSYALPLSGGTLTGGITATNFTGPGTGLTGNATSLTAGAVPWSGITSKPTTLSGFGITDAASINGASNQNFSANAIYPYEWIRFMSASGIYWQSGSYAGWHIHPQALWGMSFRSASTDCGLQLRRSNDVLLGSVYSDGTSIGFLDASNGWGASFTIAGAMNRGTVPGSLVTGNISGSAGAVAWSGITSKPTTLAGFGITDALPLAGGTLTGALNGTTAAFSGAITQGGNQVLHAGNYTSYTLPKGGSWYGANLPGTRWGGMTSAGGEIVFGQDLPAAGQMGILIDGCYIAAENNGFWSLASSNDWTTRRGMYFDGTYLRFDYNSATAYFSNASIGGNQVLHAGNYTSYPDTTKLPLAGGTLTGQVQISAGHGNTRFQLYENYNNDTNHAQAAYLTLWASEPGLTWTGAGIGANINIGGQYYGRAGTGQAYGVYIRFDAIYGRTEFYNTTGVPGTIGGQGTLRAKIEPDGEIYATASLYKVLHAGNYTSYSPPLGGTGATGVWPISITGNASGSSASAGYLTGGEGNFYGILYNNTSGNLNLYNTPGLISAEYVGTTNNPTGSQSNGHFIQISDAGGTDVKTQWYYQSGGIDISMRLMWGNGSWLPWRKLLHDGNYNSYALPLAGGTLTGSITATNHIGPGTGLTGTAPGLNIGGNANNITQYTVNQSVGTGNSPSFTGLSVINTITGSVSGNSGTVTNATFYRQFTVRDDRSDGGNYSLAGRPTGLYAIAAAGTNGPGATYLSLIHAANSNDVAFQIAGGYTSDAMYFRGTYALQNGTGYSTWRTVIHSGNIASQTVATAGSCTGSAAQLNGQAASYYENRDTTAVGFSAGTLTLTRAAGNLTVSLDGRYLTANQTITLNGDVTGSGTTAITTTIANSTVTNAKLNTMGAATIKGNNGAVANSPLDLTVAQVATMLSGQAMNINGSSASCTGNAASASSLAADTSTRFKILTFTGEGGDSGNGALPTSYGIYQQGGSWTHPYPDLCIGFHTGIKIGAYFGYGGTRFFNNSDWATEIFSVGNGDSNVRVVNTIYAAAFSGPLTGNVTGNLTGLASSATTAGNVNGYSTSTGVGANTIVVRDASGYIYGHYINTNVSESENPSINSFFTSNGDGWLRKSTVAHVKYTLSLSGTNTGDQTNISGSSGSCTGNAASVTDGVYLSTNQSISGVKTFSSAPVATNIAKAWVHYNMNNNTINASFNVSSVTDNGTGDCTVNFSSSMVDANYVVAGTATYGYDNQVIHAMILAVPRISNAQQAGSCRLVTEYIHAAGVYDSAAVRAVFYR